MMVRKIEDDGEGRLRRKVVYVFGSRQSTSAASQYIVAESALPL
jgi:hypothetical protein